jgi:hypothetical protein
VAVLSTALATLALAAAAPNGCGATEAGVVRLERSDGATFEDHLAVCRDRRAAVRFRRAGGSTVCRAFVLSPPRFADLRNALDAARFAQLQFAYVTRPPPARVIAYVVRYRNRSVAADDVALSKHAAPARFIRLVRLLASTTDAALAKRPRLKTTRCR